MKRNKFFMLGIVTVLVAVLSLTFVSNTFAKYTSTVTGSDSARVAKWQWTYEKDPIDNTKIKFDLFNTIKDSDGTNETDIKYTDGTIIAPGTQGSFVLSFTNASEVTAQYAINYTVTKSDSNIAIEFSTDGGSTWSDDLADVAADDTTKLTVGSAEKQITVQWRWVFENGAGDVLKENDKTDTTLGLAGTATVTVEADVTFTQVD